MLPLLTVSGSKEQPRNLPVLRDSAFVKVINEFSKAGESQELCLDEAIDHLRHSSDGGGRVDP